MRSWRSYSFVFVLLASILAGQPAVAAPLRIATSNYVPAGEVDIKFVDAVTVDDGALYVLTSGLAFSQPKLRLTRYTVNGVRSWSRSITVPSIPIETAELMKPASLLALEGGRVLVLSQRAAPVETPTATIDMVARIFDGAGTLSANYGISPMVLAVMSLETNLTSGQAIVANDRRIWIAADGTLPDGNTTSVLIKFDRHLNRESLVYDAGSETFDDMGDADDATFSRQISKKKTMGMTSRASQGVVIATQNFSTNQSDLGDYSSSETTIVDLDNRLREGSANYDSQNSSDLWDFSSHKAYDFEVSGSERVVSYRGYDRTHYSLLTLTSGLGFGLTADFDDGQQIEPLGSGLFVVGGFARFGLAGEKRMMLGWGGSFNEEFFQGDNSMVLPLAPDANQWVLGSLQTDSTGMSYLAGGPTLGGKESIGIAIAWDSEAEAADQGATWQLTNSTGTFGAKRLLPTIQNRVFAVGVNAAGVIGMQLFQQPTYYRGISVSEPKLNPGDTGYLNVSLAQPAPADYVVSLSVPRNRFSGMPTSITVPEGQRSAAVMFTVLPGAPLGDATITTRVDRDWDTVNAVHTATVTITNDPIERP